MTIKDAITDALADVKDWSAYRLANEADCGTPDNRESEGARFLTDLRDEVVNLVEENIDDIEDTDWFDTVNDNGAVSEIADGAPSIWTSTVWQQFTDLRAYHEDPTDLGFDGSEMEKAAGICLYTIAERLAYAILTYVREAVEGADAEDEEL